MLFGMEDDSAAFSGNAPFAAGLVLGIVAHIDAGQDKEEGYLRPT